AEGGTPPLRDVQSLTDWVWRVNTKGSLAEAVAATSFAIEGVTGAIARRVCAGFEAYRDRPGVDMNPRTYKWIREHSHYDDEHPKFALEIVKHYAITPRMQRQVMYAAKRSLELLHLALVTSTQTLPAKMPASLSREAAEAADWREGRFRPERHRELPRPAERAHAAAPDLREQRRHAVRFAIDRAQYVETDDVPRALPDSVQRCLPVQARERGLLHITVPPQAFHCLHDERGQAFAQPVLRDRCDQAHQKPLARISFRAVEGPRKAKREERGGLGLEGEIGKHVLHQRLFGEPSAEGLAVRGVV